MQTPRLKPVWALLRDQRTCRPGTGQRYPSTCTVPRQSPGRAPGQGELLPSIPSLPPGSRPRTGEQAAGNRLRGGGVGRGGRKAEGLGLSLSCLGTGRRLPCPRDLGLSAPRQRTHREFHRHGRLPGKGKGSLWDPGSSQIRGDSPLCPSTGDRPVGGTELCRGGRAGPPPPCVSHSVLNDAKQGWSWRLGLITFNYNNCCLSPVFCISPWGKSLCCFFSRLAPAFSYRLDRSGPDSRSDASRRINANRPIDWEE